MILWATIIIVVAICILLSRIEDYTHFDFNEEAIFIGKKKVVEIKYNAIKLIERSPFISYESDVSYITYNFYCMDETGNESKVVLRRRGSLKVFQKWQRFKDKLLQANPAAVINENIV